MESECKKPAEDKNFFPSFRNIKNERDHNGLGKEVLIADIVNFENVIEDSKETIILRNKKCTSTA